MKKQHTLNKNFEINVSSVKPCSIQKSKTYKIDLGDLLQHGPEIMFIILYFVIVRISQSRLGAAVFNIENQVPGKKLHTLNRL